MTESSPDDRLSVGTLHYTSSGLVRVFIWLLTGSLGFGLVTSAVPTLLPLTLRELGTNNLVIGLFVGSIPALINLLVNPVVSFKSDRTRTRWGRRRPYLLAATPAIGLLLALIGWTGPLMRSLPIPSDYVTVCAIVFLGVVVVAYQIFYMLVGSTIYYLFVDVMPAHYLGRYTALFNMVGALKGFLFNRYCLQYADGYAPQLYTAIAAVYTVLMLVMIRNVKEGEYPPVTDGGKNTPVWECIRIYCRECFSIPFYLWIFLATGINSSSTVCRSLFGIFFARDELGLSLEKIGTVNGYAGLLAAVLALPLGFLNDRIHPLKIFTFGGILVIAINACSFFLIRDYPSYFFWTMLLMGAYTLQLSSSLPMTAALFPRSHYGQFGSAQAMCVSVLLIVANLGGGIFMDRIGNYRYLYVWDFILTCIALFSLVVVFVLWKKYGGEKNYTAPLRT